MKKELEERFTDGQLMLMDGDYEGSIAVFAEILETDPKFVKAWQAKAVALFKQGDFKAALEDIDRAIACEPENHRLHYHKAGMLFKHNKYDEAMECISRAIEIAPQYPPAYLLRSKIFEITGEEELSAADLSKAINLRKQQTDVVDF